MSQPPQLYSVASISFTCSMGVPKPNTLFSVLYRFLGGMRQSMDKILKVTLEKTMRSSARRLPNAINEPLQCFMSKHYEHAANILSVGAYYIDEVTHGRFLIVSIILFDIDRYFNLR